MQQFLEEVTKETQRLVDPAIQRSGRAPGEIYRLKVRVPHVRAALMSGYSFFGASQRDLVRIWDYIWNNSDCYEVMSQALYFYQGRSLSPGEVRNIRKWVERCDCWDETNDDSGSKHREPPLAPRQPGDPNGGRAARRGHRSTEWCRLACVPRWRRCQVPPVTQPHDRPREPGSETGSGWP